MKSNGMCNYSERLLNYCLNLETTYEGISDMLINVLKANDINRMILDKVPAENDKLLLAEGFVDLILYHDINRCIRLLSLVGKMPQAVIDEEAEFLFGCPFRYEMMSQAEIDKFGLKKDAEKFDNIWLVFGKFGEIRMAVQMYKDDGTFCPVITVPIQSDYEEERNIFKRELIDNIARKRLADRIFYDRDCVCASDDTYLYVNHKDDIIKEFYLDTGEDKEKFDFDEEIFEEDNEEDFDYDEEEEDFDDGEEIFDYDEEEEEFDDGEEIFDYDEEEEEFDDGEEVFDYDEEECDNQLDNWNCITRSMKKDNGIYIFIELNQRR